MLKADALNLNEEALEHCHYVITNPPFEWRVLQPLLDKWINLRPTVLLLPADFMHNQRFSNYLKMCEKVVSIGRVKWIEGSTMTSVDNFAWYFFNKDFKGPTAFYGRDN